MGICELVVSAAIVCLKPTPVPEPIALDCIKVKEWALCIDTKLDIACYQEAAKEYSWEKETSGEGLVEHLNEECSEQ